MLQPIENSSQTWLVTRHQYGLMSSFLTTQTSSCGGNRKLHRETSAVTAQAKRKERFLWLHYVTLICSRWSSRRVPSKARMALLPHFILGDPGADSGGKGKSKRAEKYGTKESKERREETLGTNFLPDQFQTVAGRQFQTVGRAIFSRPFRLSLAPSICPWVSEDVPTLTKTGTNKSAFFLKT